MKTSANVRAAVENILPSIRAAAAQCERERHIPDASIALLRELGAFRSLQPKRFGGYEESITDFFETTAAIGSACASTGWVYGIFGVHQWAVAQFSERAQAEVWPGGCQSLVSGTYAPSGKAVEVGGGFRLTGRWSFASGCDHANWHVVGALCEDAAGSPLDMGFLLFPASDLEVHDNWFVGGLCGTGSKDVSVSGLFVPAHRVLWLRDALAATTPGNAVNTSTLYRLPFFTVVTLSIVSAIVGAAEGALKVFIEDGRVRRRRGAPLAGKSKAAESVVMQARVAEAAGLIEAARLLITRDLAATTAAADADGVDVQMRVRNRRDYALAVRLCVQGIDALYSCSGASGLFVPNILERTWRDVNAAAKHVGLNWDSIGPMFGQHALGEVVRGQY